MIIKMLKATRWSGETLNEYTGLEGERCTTAYPPQAMRTVMACACRFLPAGGHVRWTLPGRACCLLRCWRIHSLGTKTTFLNLISSLLRSFLSKFIYSLETKEEKLAGFRGKGIGLRSARHAWASQPTTAAPWGMWASSEGARAGNGLGTRRHMRRCSDKMLNGSESGDKVCVAWDYVRPASDNLKALKSRQALSVCLSLSLLSFSL